MRLAAGFLVAGLATLTAGGPAAALPLSAYDHDLRLAARIQAIATGAAHAYLFEGDRPSGLPHLDPRLASPLGAFVTITSGTEVRGCWGSVAPEYPTLAEQVAHAAVQALRDDYRHRPVAASEWPRLRFTVALVGPLEPLDEPQALAPRRDGLLVTARGRTGVLLPGEALTTSWAVFECRRKAGLRQGEPARLYRFRTVRIPPAEPRRTP